MTHELTNEHSSDHDGMAAQPVHLRQQHSWDCGVTCCAMVVAALHRAASSEAPSAAGLVVEDDRGLQRALEASVGTESTWTADLAFVLVQLGVPCSLFSTCLGVNESYRDMAFYRDEVDADRERVEARMATLRASPLITIEERLFSTDELLAEASTGNVWFIVLVDSHRLARRSGLLGSLSAAAMAAIGAFAGHYVVVVGARRDAADELVALLLDPADSSRSLSECSRLILDEARACRGTDHDVIRLPLVEAVAAWRRGLRE